MSAGVAIAEITSRTLIWLAVIGAFVRVSPPVLTRLGLANSRQAMEAAAARQDVPARPVTGGPSQGEGS